MKTFQWVKKLGGYADELYVAAELYECVILNMLLPGMRKLGDSAHIFSKELLFGGHLIIKANKGG